MKKRDFVFITLLMVVFLILLLIIREENNGTYITVSQDGKVIGSYALTEKEQVIEIGENNVLTIINNEAYMRNALCPDKICMERGKISKVGEEIICMPNRVIIRVEGGSGDE